jgi:hypothetical protein
MRLKRMLVTAVTATVVVGISGFFAFAPGDVHSGLDEHRPVVRRRSWKVSFRVMPARAAVS